MGAAQSCEQLGRAKCPCCCSGVVNYDGDCTNRFCAQYKPDALAVDIGLRSSFLVGGKEYDIFEAGMLRGFESFDGFDKLVNCLRSI